MKLNHAAPKSARRWASIKAAADHLGVTTRTVHQMITDGRIIGYRNGKRIVRVDLNEIDAQMQPFGGGAAL
jgi:excisionase family DNA binding protein